MTAPTYVVKKLGDRYIAVRQDCPAHGAAYAAGGAGLCVAGRCRGGMLGLAAQAVGAGLVLRGLLGYNPLELLRPDGRARDATGNLAPSYQNDFPGRAPQAPADIVDEQSMESFPASDAPARTGVSL